MRKQTQITEIRRVPSYKQLEVGQTEHRFKMKITTQNKKVDQY